VLESSPLASDGAAWPPRRLSLRRNTNVMKTHAFQGRTAESRISKFPAYPWSGCQIMAALRARLAGAAQTGSMSFDRLARLVGKSKSSTHHWFQVSPPAGIVALFCWLERLSPAERHVFVDAHCRVFPSLEHPWLAHASAQIVQLEKLLRQERGLTLVSGGTESARAFVVTAMGHAHRRLGGKRQGPAGIDLHPSVGFVPVESLVYLDYAADSDRVRQLVLEIWPRILTSSAGLLIFNGLWSRVPEIRGDLLRCARHKHVVLAEAQMPNLADMEDRVCPPRHGLSLFSVKGMPGAIRVVCRRLTTQKNMAGIGRLQNKTSKGLDIPRAASPKVSQ
jgi:hypothetical protein